jgi:hypothetical protein
MLDPAACAGIGLAGMRTTHYRLVWSALEDAFLAGGGDPDTLVPSRRAHIDDDDLDDDDDDDGEDALERVREVRARKAK